MSASDDYLRGRRDAVDEVLHLMGDYAMAGIGDRELRRELRRMRDEASAANSGGRDRGHAEGRNRKPGAR